MDMLCQRKESKMVHLRIGVKERSVFFFLNFLATP